MSRAVDAVFNLHEIEQREVEQRVRDAVWQAFLDKLDGIQEQFEQVNVKLGQLLAQGINTTISLLSGNS